MIGYPPNKNIPVIWADFNAIGLSNEDSDNCCYSLHTDTLQKISPYEGMKVFIYDDDINDQGKAEIFGYIATLEMIVGFNSDWRARPDEKTLYRGPAPWLGEK